MKSKKLIIIFMLLTVKHSETFAQDHKIPKVIRDERDKPNKTVGIRYYFPERVSVLIDSAVTKCLKEAKSAIKFNIELAQSDDTIELFGYSHRESKRNEKELGKTVSELLIEYTNRYLISNSIIIPIYFSTDILYSFASFATTDYSFYIKFCEDRLIEVDIR